MWELQTGLMVSTLNSRSNGRGSSPGFGHFVLFLKVKTLNATSASLHPSVEMGNGKIMLWGNPVMD